MPKGIELTRKRFRATKRSPGKLPTPSSIFIEQNHSKECFFFQDEVGITLNGDRFNKNCHIWSETNPQFGLAHYIQKRLTPEQRLLGCAILFQNDEGHNVTVNGDRYRDDYALFDWLRQQTKMHACPGAEASNKTAQRVTQLHPEKRFIESALWDRLITFWKR
ncbi:hypothetical protein TNCV_4121551 [Trichonephila clavipes]|nr:hypothetical protein TNCV_4121551 [Trichonephila clavipes]